MFTHTKQESSGARYPRSAPRWKGCEWGIFPHAGKNDPQRAKALILQTR